MRDRDLPQNDYAVPWLLCNLGLVLARVIWGVSIPRAATIGTSRVARQLVPLVIGTCSSQSRGRAYQDPMASSPACKAAQGHHGVAEAHRNGGVARHVIWVSADEQNLRVRARERQIRDMARCESRILSELKCES